MLAPQLTGRLLSVMDENANIQNLLNQCDEEGPTQNALVPAFHCMHTPGGPLKYSLEGHQFAVFGFKLTPDLRYIVSVSNKFITWDVATSDLVREVSPGVGGLMMDLEISPDNRFIAAYTSNNEVILLNALVSEVTIIKNPFGATENIVGLVLLDANLIAYGKWNWAIYSTNGGKMIKTHQTRFINQPILSMKMLSVEDFSLINWSGDVSLDTSLIVSTFKEGEELCHIELHTAIVINRAQTKVWGCQSPDSNIVAMYQLVQDKWQLSIQYEKFSKPFLQLKMSSDEHFVIGTFSHGFQLWKTSKFSKMEQDIKGITLKLPYQVYNVSIFMCPPSCIHAAEAK